MRYLGFYATVLLLIVQPGCHIKLGSFGAKFKKDAVQTIPNVDDSLLRVESSNGSIKVMQADRDDVLINAEIRAKTQERLDACEIIAQRQPDGTLFIEPLFPEKRQGSEGCSFEIEIPNASGVELETSNGRISLTGLTGSARLKSSNGSISAQNFQGSVDINTSNGRVTAENVAGTIEIGTSNGSVDIKNSRDHVKVSTSNGSISLSQAEDSSGSIDLKTSNGSVKVDLCADFSGKLDAKTSNASIKNSTDGKVLEKGKRKQLLQFGEGSAYSRIRSSNGSISIRQAGG